MFERLTIPASIALLLLGCEPPSAASEQPAEAVPAPSDETVAAADRSPAVHQAELAEPTDQPPPTLPPPTSTPEQPASSGPLPSVPPKERAADEGIEPQTSKPKVKVKPKPKPKRPPAPPSTAAYAAPCETDAQCVLTNVGLCKACRCSWAPISADRRQAYSQAVVAYERAECPGVFDTRSRVRCGCGSRRRPEAVCLEGRCQVAK